MPQIMVATDKLMAYRKTLFGSDASVPHHFSTPSQVFHSQHCDSALVPGPYPVRRTVLRDHFLLRRTLILRLSKVIVHRFLRFF
jgi:hypothetical protein